MTPVPEPELDNGNQPITWTEIIVGLILRPLVIIRLVGGRRGDPEIFDPHR